MTALAVALVLCCAMVCGTYLLRCRYAMREREAELAITSGGVMRRDLDGLRESCTALKSELESLRASVALRSL